MMFLHQKFGKISTGKFRDIFVNKKSLATMENAIKTILWKIQHSRWLSSAPSLFEAIELKGSYLI